MAASSSGTPPCCGSWTAPRSDGPMAQGPGLGGASGITGGMMGWFGRWRFRPTATPWPPAARTPQSGSGTPRPCPRRFRAGRGPVAAPPTETLRAVLLELFDAAQATLTIEENVHRVDVTAVDGTGWHAHCRRCLTTSRKARPTRCGSAPGPMPRPTEVYGQIGEPDCHGIGLNEVVPLTADWQTYEREFRAKDLAASNLIQFHVGERTGTVWIADITLTKATK